MSKVDVSSENGGCGCDSVRNACRCLRTDVYVWLLTATALALVCCRILAFLLRCKFSFFRGCCKPRCIEPESPSSKVCVLKLEKTLLQRLRPPSGQSHADLNSRHPQSVTGGYEIYTGASALAGNPASKGGLAWQRVRVAKALQTMAGRDSWALSCLHVRFL